MGPLIDTVVGVTLGGIFALVGFITRSVLIRLTGIDRSVAQLANAYLKLAYRIRRIEDALDLDHGIEPDLSDPD